MSEQIQTYDEIKNEWIDCQHETWHEIKADGWVFEYMENNSICMSRNGFLNFFRGVEK